MALLMCLFLFAGVSAQTEQTASREFTTVGTTEWSLPTNVHVTGVTIEAIGGGGAGGYVEKPGTWNINFQAAGGGSGAAYAKSTLTDFSQGETFTITVGAGGTNVDGNTVHGGNSVVSSNGTNWVVAAGGMSVTGTNTVEGAQAQAATVSTGNVLVNIGGNGGNSFGSDEFGFDVTASGAGGGAGGSTSAGGDAVHATSGNPGDGGAGGGGDAGAGHDGSGTWNSWPGNALAGFNYGGGGAGAWCTGDVIGFIPNKGNGGAGAQGLVRITYTYLSEAVEIEDAEATVCSGAEYDIALDVIATGFELTANNFVVLFGDPGYNIAMEGGSIYYNNADSKWHFKGIIHNLTNTTQTNNHISIKVTTPDEVMTDEANITLTVYGNLDGGVIAEGQFVCQDHQIQVIQGDGSVVNGVTTAPVSGGSGDGTYAWYREFYTGGTSGQVSGANTENYIPSDGETGDYFLIRVYKDNVCGTEVSSNELEVTTVDPFVQDPFEYDPDTICSNESKTITLAVTNTSSPAWDEFNAYFFDWSIYWQKSTDKGATWENLVSAQSISNGLEYEVNLTPADFSAGDDIWYRYALKPETCDSIPSNGVYMLHVKDLPDYTDQFEDLEITLWYGACDTAIAVPELIPTPASITRADNYGDRLVPGEYELRWNVIADDCNIPVEYAQNVTVEFPECGTLEEPKTVFDADGKEYQTIRIGCDCWFAENLRTNAPDAAYYDDDDANEAFGKLYTWADAVGVNNEEHSTMLGTTFIQGICPEGWAIPSVAQYNTMLAKAGGAQAIMSDEESAWLPGYAGTNASGFGAMGAGYYESLQYQRQLGYTYFWTSDLNVNNSNVAKVMELRCGCDEFTCREKSKEDKVSVRCVRVSEGEPATFTCGTSKMKDADGNEYGTVLIGTQCWTKTNLRVAPAGATNEFASGNNSETEAYYYVDPSVDASVYGYYYNRPAAMLACPAGWHLPTTEEWIIMEQSQTTMDVSGTEEGWYGDFAGKLVGGNDWQSSTEPNAPGNYDYADRNTSGFSAVPAGYWWEHLQGVGTRTDFWTSSEVGGLYWVHFIENGSSAVSRYTDIGSFGNSVRCLKDAE